MSLARLLPSTILAPVLTLVAALWLGVHGLALLADTGRTGCWFPAEYLYSHVDETGWHFSDAATAATTDTVMIDRARLRRSPGYWPRIVEGKDWVIIAPSCVEVKADPRGFLVALEKWVAAEPGGESQHAAALETVRTLLKSNSTLDVSGRFIASTTRFKPIAAAHNATTLLLLVAGPLAAVAWAKQARTRRIERARLAVMQCPGCAYDMSGLPTAVCPECGQASATRDEQS